MQLADKNFCTLIQNVVFMSITIVHAVNELRYKKNWSLFEVFLKINARRRVKTAELLR